MSCSQSYSHQKLSEADKFLIIWLYAIKMQFLFGTYDMIWTLCDKFWKFWKMYRYEMIVLCEIKFRNPTFTAL